MQLILWPFEIQLYMTAKEIN